MAKQEWDVLVVGQYFCDLVFTNLPEFPRLGHEVYANDFHLIPGGVYTPAVTLNRLGINVAWPCLFGSDVFSKWVKSEAIKNGLDDGYFDDLPNPSLRITTAFSFGEERAFLSYTQDAPEPAYSKIMRELDPKWLYLTNLKTGEEFRELVQTARDLNAKIFMDCQANKHTLDEHDVKEALAAVDVFSPNADEARQIAGDGKLESAAAALADLTPTLIIKNGKDGCLCHQGSYFTLESAIEVDVVDTTGAGDNFNCGFLYGQIHGFSLADSLRIANICGGLSVQAHGGTGYILNEKDIQSRLDNK